jgi:hypothetical protein
MAACLLSPGREKTLTPIHPLPFSALSLLLQEIVRSSTARDGSFKQPLTAPEICAALADQKRIALDPALFTGGGLPITRQGRHALPLRILTGPGGDQRVALNVAVGAAVGSAPGGGGDAEGEAGAAGAGKKGAGGGGGKKKK